MTSGLDDRLVNGMSVDGSLAQQEGAVGTYQFVDAALEAQETTACGPDNGPLSLPGPDWPIPSWRDHSYAAATVLYRADLRRGCRGGDWLQRPAVMGVALAITQDVLDSAGYLVCRSLIDRWQVPVPGTEPRSHFV